MLVISLVEKSQREAIKKQEHLILEGKNWGNWHDSNCYCWYYYI